jgi:hypothetical protein
MTREARAATLVVVSVMALTAGGALAAEPASSLAGSWTLAASPDQERQRLAAIDGATGHLRSMQRGRARERLAERTSPPDQLTIGVEGSRVTVGSQGRELELELGGAPIEVSGDQGNARLGATMEGDALVVTADTGKAQRTTRYRADGDRLSMEVTMTGAMLDPPLTYVTIYTRAE